MQPKRRGRGPPQTIAVTHIEPQPARSRRQAKDMEQQRSLADQAELSRFTELRAYMQGELMLANQRSEEQHAQLLAKLDRLEANLGTHIEQLLQK